MEIIAAAKLSALSFFIRIKQSRNRPAAAGGRRRRTLAKRLGYSDKRKGQEITRIGLNLFGVRRFGYCADAEDRSFCANGAVPRYYSFKSPVAGLSISFPSRVKREPWHGQSQECSCGFHFRAQPMCGQRLPDIVSRFVIASKALTASCGRSMLLDGENTGAKRFSLSTTISASSFAAAIDEVIPHLL